MRERTPRRTVEEREKLFVRHFPRMECGGDESCWNHCPRIRAEDSDELSFHDDRRTALRRRLCCVIELRNEFSTALGDPPLLNIDPFKCRPNADARPDDEFAERESGPNLAQLQRDEIQGW
ncbi:MAG TPA: hypothetical protein VNN25_21905 [Thermoanaerobaculia bacterium]|nr:hypothetical protein [Thermoanaerobaculia bacterium]